MAKKKEPIKEQESKQDISLNNDNYHSPMATKAYLGSSTFKNIYGHPADPNPCEARALFMPTERTEALLVGGYVDAAFESDKALKEYIEQNESDLKLKSGKGFYKFVTDANEAIDRARQDKLFMDYMQGEKQRIMTGVIAGHPFKIKMDAYIPNQRIVDLKYVRDAGESYVEALKTKATFIENYGYAIQGAIYREIESQNNGRKLPFYIAYITKETVPDFGVVEIPENILDDALEYVELALKARPLSDVKADPHACGRRSCPWCRNQLVLTKPYTFDEFIERSKT